MYKYKYKNKTFTAPNLESALEKLGYTNIKIERITKNFDDKLNHVSKKYKAYTLETTIILIRTINNVTIIGE